MVKSGQELTFLAAIVVKENLATAKGMCFIILCKEDREKKKEEIQENKGKVKW